MSIKKSYSAFMILAVTMVFVMVMAVSAVAGEQVRTQSMITSEGQVDEATQLRLLLKNQLQKESGLSVENIAAIDPLLEEALRLNGGDTEAVRKMVRKSVQIDCVDECLMERLRKQNRQMLQEHKELRGEDQLASQERDRIRTQSRDGEQSGDLTRTETRTQTQSQTQDQTGSQGGSNGGSSKGGGKGR